MESNMVNEDLFDNKFFLSYADAKSVTVDFFKNNMQEFSLKEDEDFGMAFLLRYKDGINSIHLSSDRGDLSYKLTIRDDEVNLFLFEPLLSNVEWFSRKNILFVLNTIQRYLKMKMKISITVEINETDAVFESLEDTNKVSIDIAFNKYKFDVLRDNQEKRLDYMAIEASYSNKNLLIGNTAYNLEEVLYFNNELKKHSLSLDTVYIPSEERINFRIQIAIGEQRKWGYREGISNEEIERNFEGFKETLKAIKDGLENTSIKIKEV